MTSGKTRVAPQEEEEWRPVLGFPGYCVSNFGRVRSERRVFSPSRDTQGYRFVRLRLDGKSFARSVHALVCSAFVGPRPRDFDINHMDADRENNRLTNLEYCSRRDNVFHGLAIRAGAASPGMSAADATAAHTTALRAARTATT